MSRLLVGLLSFSFMSAHAAIIEVTANVGWSCSSVFKGFESPTCELQRVEHGKLRFTYSTDVADIDPLPTNDVFPNAILSFDMTIEQVTRPDLHWVLTPGIGNEITRSGFSLDHSFLTLSVTLSDLTGAFANPALFFFNILGTSSPPPPRDIPGLDFWTGHFMGPIGFGASGAGARELDWTTAFGAQLLPQPPPYALLVLALWILAISSRFRRSRGDHPEEPVSP